MNNWVEVTLREAGSWHSGGTPSTSVHEYWEGDIPWISAASLKNFFIETSDRKVTKLGAENGTRLAPPETVLFVVRGMSLMKEFRIGITRREVAFGQDCKALIPNKGIDPYFLAYAIQAKSEQILRLVDMAGHGTGRLQTDRIAKLTIAIPKSLDTQKGTVKLLQSLDEKLALNRKISHTCEELAIFLASSSATSYAPLSDLVTQDRKQINPEQMSEAVVDHFSLPAFDAERTPEICPPKTIKSGKFHIQAESVLLSKLNPKIPRAWHVIPESERTALASTEFLVLRNRSEVTAAEIWTACSQPAFIDQLAKKATGTSTSHQRATPTDVLANPVLDPRTLPKAIRKLVSILIERARVARFESISLTKLRETLLPKLMSGNMQITVPDDLLEEAI